jgi:hypothetical protein
VRSRRSAPSGRTSSLVHPGAVSPKFAELDSPPTLNRARIVAKQIYANAALVWTRARMRFERSVLRSPDWKDLVAVIA